MSVEVHVITDPRIFNWTNEQLERASEAAARHHDEDAKALAVSQALAIPLAEAYELLEVSGEGA